LAVLGLALTGLLAYVSKGAAPIVAIPLLGTLIGLVVELIWRFDERSAAEDLRSTLLAATDGREWLLEELCEIASNAKDALDDDQNGKLFEELLGTKLKGTRLFVQDLKRGHISVPAGDLTPMGNQIDSVETQVRATTIPAVDTEWWLSRAGRDYLKRNERAIKRKVSIQRIVIWEAGDNTEKLAEVIKGQLKAEVEILFVKREEIEKKELKTTMAIYDESSYNYVAFNFDGESTYVEYYLEPSDAGQAIARYSQLRGIASSKVPPELTHVVRAVEEFERERSAPATSQDREEAGPEGKQPSS
jgi:hypothetical protein